ncbi:MAG: outer membrane beta-barrel domain-containing protein [Deltaproteobacteria bacterium]|nr:outer membrane beta-barrel domain-containing protein [Deltaproteobacteria bacterium]
MYPSHRRNGRCPRRGRILVSTLAVLVAGLIALQAPSALALEADLDQGKVFAIQNRDYRMNHEFSVSMAFLPLDAFYKFFAISGHYVLHFNDLWAWEAIHFSFAKYLDIDTGLKKQMNDDWDVSATDTPKIDYFIDTNLMIKPMYGKVALFDNWVIYVETYFLIGIGAEKFQTAWFPAANLGVGLRIFITDTISLKLEAREYLYLEEGGVDSTLYLGLGFCYNAFAEDKPTEKVRPDKEVGL